MNTVLTEFIWPALLLACHRSIDPLQSLGDAFNNMMHDDNVVRMPWPKGGCLFGAVFGTVSVPGHDMHAGHIRQTEIAYHGLARLPFFIAVAVT